MTLAGRQALRLGQKKKCILSPLLNFIGKPPQQNPNNRQTAMTTVPGQLVWEIVKRNNSFLVKEFGNGSQSVQFSKEPNNLYNLNSYKHSGLANKKTVTIQPAGKDQSILLATSKTKKQSKPASLLHKSIMKKEFNSMAKAVVNQVANNFYRPDLKKAALARLSAVSRSLKVTKSGAKKKNRQASRTYEVIVGETSERNSRSKAQCVHELDSASVGGSDLQPPFSSVGFSEVVEPSVGKVGIASGPSLAIPINNGCVANESSLDGHTLQANVEGGNDSAAATSMDEAATHIALSLDGCIAHIGVSDIGADSVVNDPGTCATSSVMVYACG
ncbi:60S ribosomal protein L28-2-like protein [Tanacetum coccineum]